MKTITVPQGLQTKEQCAKGVHELDLMERSWPEPRGGTTWLYCARCQKHVWTVPTKLLA